jgi:hypothetical protein
MRGSRLFSRRETGRNGRDGISNAGAEAPRSLSHSAENATEDARKAPFQETTSSPVVLAPSVTQWHKVSRAGAH